MSGEWVAGSPPARQDYAAFGVRFGLRADSQEGFGIAKRYVPLGWIEKESGDVDLLYALSRSPRSDSDSRMAWRLYAGEELICSDNDVGIVLRAFAEHAQMAMMWRSRTHLFVHAGVVGWQGRAILVPGRSFSGKSSLTRALVQAGAEYYSDEYAVLDARGRVHPYPLALSVRSGDGTSTKLTVAELGGRQGRAPLPVGLIVNTHYAPRARWRPRNLSRALAFLALMDNTVAAQREPAYAMPILRAAVLSAAAVTGPRGEAARTVPHILRLVPTS